LYSAVLTPFIIESMKLLEEDPTERTSDILFIISQQLANNSFPPYQPVKHETPDYAIVVNGLFFMSLSFGLIVALLAVLALQWVANYDVGLNTSSPRKRALQRQLRWAGVVNWNMAEIIAFLPLLIFISLFLFFIGIADWLWHMNRIISGIVIGGIGIGLLLYAVTTMMSIITIEAPFRTPVSKGLALLAREPGAWPRTLFAGFPLISVKWYNREQLPRPQIQDAYSNEKPIPSKSFLKQEDLLIEGKKEMSIDCLLWLANSIEVSSNSQAQLMSLVKSLVEVPAELLMQEKKLDDAPWEAIFTALCSPYIDRPVNEWTGDEVQKAIDICQGMSVIPNALSSSALTAFVWSINRLGLPLASAISSLALARDIHSGKYNDTLRHAVKPNVTAELGENYIYFILLNLQSEWDTKDIIGNRGPLLEHIGLLCAIPTDKVRNTTPIPCFPIPLLEVILNLVTRLHDSEPIVDTGKKSGTLVDKYTSLARRLMEEDPDGVVHRLHRGIQQQLLAQISRVDPLSRSVVIDFKALVEFLLQISSCKPLALTGEELNNFIFILTRRNGRVPQIQVFDWLWNGLRATCAVDGGLEDKFITVITAVDDYLTSENALIKGDYEFLSSLVNYLPWVRGPTDDIFSWGYKPSPWNKLSHIRDPCLAWQLLSWCPNNWQFQSLIQPDFCMLEDRGDILPFPIYFINPRRELPYSAVTFVRTLVIDGSPKMQELAMRILGEQMESHKWMFQRLIPKASKYFSPYCRLYVDHCI
jgi:hypothetical protein